MRKLVRRMPDFPEQDELRIVLQAYLAGGQDLEATAQRVAALTHDSGWSIFAKEDPDQPDQVARVHALVARVQFLVIERLREEGRLPPAGPGTA